MLLSPTVTITGTVSMVATFKFMTVFITLTVCPFCEIMEGRAASLARWTLDPVVDGVADVGSGLKANSRLRLARDSSTSIRLRMLCRTTGIRCRR